MKARTEEFLYCMLWTAETLTQPTFRNVTESFEGWAYRSGLLRRLSELEKRHLVERKNFSERIYRLTSAGRVHALGGRDPEEYWSREWDGKWRLICFDVPTTQNRQRRSLRHYLRSQMFGLLQRSIWITPDPLKEQAQLLCSEKVAANSLVFLEARTCGGESNDDIVRTSWNFQRINALYARHLKILEKRPPKKIVNQSQAQALRRWAQNEHSAWTRAVQMDPLLPASLLPADYLGRRAWRRRVEELARVGRSTTDFKTSGDDIQ